MKRNRDILELTKSLSMLAASGLTIQDSVRLTKTIQTRKRLSELLGRVSERLDRGISFSSAIGEEGIFPPLYRGLVEIGERGGKLNLVFNRLAGYLESNRKVSDKLQSALIYPVILLVLITVGVGCLIIFFIPNLQSSLSFDPDIAAELELSLHRAKLILWCFIFSVMCGLLCYILLKFLADRENEFSILLHRSVFHIPVLRKVVLKNEMLNLFFALYLMAECRIPLEESMKLALLVISNPYLKGQVYLIRMDLIKGESLSSLFRRQVIFPREIAGWVGLGEKMGNVESVFGQLKDLYQADVDNISEKIIALVEPLTSLVIGIILIVIVLVLIVPLMTIYGGLI